MLFLLLLEYKWENVERNGVRNKTEEKRKKCNFFVHRIDKHNE